MFAVEFRVPRGGRRWYTWNVYETMGMAQRAVELIPFSINDVRVRRA